MKLRRDYCLQQQSSHLWSAKFYRAIAPTIGVIHRRKAVGAHEQNLPTVDTVTPLRPPLIAVDEHIYSADVLAGYHADLKKKYHRVASRPWLTLAPDPPAPEYR